MEELLIELFEDLEIELKDEQGYSETLLKSKIKNAVREVKSLRNYPDGYSEELILADMDKLYSKIRARALYDYNKVGSEDESEHDENGTKRSWKSKDALYPIIPFCTVI